MELNSQNYHSLEANRHYMSNSQLKDFEDCEAAAMAKLSGEYIAPSNDAFLFGSYVHAYVEGTLDEFKENTPELFNSKGELYAKYETAGTMIETIKRDPFIQFVLQGQKEIIMTADMFGAPWKIKVDVLNLDRGRIVDLKTVKGIYTKHWNTSQGVYESFVEHYKYIRQMAVYVEVERLNSGRDGWLEPLIVAISKETVPDKEVIGFDDGRLQMELEETERLMQRVLSVKHGHEPPISCGRCNYCKRKKMLRGIIHYNDLIV